MTKTELFKALEILKEECQKYDYTLLIDLCSGKENFEYTTHVGNDEDLVASLSWIMGTLPKDVVERAIYVWQKKRKTSLTRKMIKDAHINLIFT